MWRMKERKEQERRRKLSALIDIIPSSHHPIILIINITLSDHPSHHPSHINPVLLPLISCSLFFTLPSTLRHHVAGTFPTLTQTLQLVEARTELTCGEDEALCVSR
jgi:hypothetical protein